MLAEYAIIPEVFNPASYSSSEACDKRLRELKAGLMSRGLVRNLCNGGWWCHLTEHPERWDKMGRELVRKLKQQGRLCDDKLIADKIPEDSNEWCVAALASHAQSPLSGILADDLTATAYPNHDLVAPMTKLSEQTWWLAGRNSIELLRSTEAYLRELGPTLRQSNSLMFIDPHLDPQRLGYGSVLALLEACGDRTPAARIEIHRVCYFGSGRERQFPTREEWKQRFESALGETVRARGLQVEVVLWDDFHDRYLISNLIGILMPNGFDVEENPSITRWARLVRDHCDSVQREFDPAVSRHAPRVQFSI